MTEPQRASERRRFIRQSLDLPVSVQLRPPKGAGPSRVQGRTRDLSNAGAYFWAPTALQIGQPLRLSLEIPCASGGNFSLRIAFEAEVVRVERGKGGEQKMGAAARVLRFETPEIIPAAVSGAD